VHVVSSAEDRIARAGEYVLGLMDEDERRRAEADIATDAAFANEVARFADQFEALQANLEPDEATDELWQAIAARLDQKGGLHSAADTSDDVAAPLPATRSNRFGGWRNALLAACLVAAFGLGYLGGQYMTPTPNPVVVVVLADDNEIPAAIIEAYGDDSVRFVPLREFDLGEGQVLEAWTQFDEDIGPVSLGTFVEQRERVLSGRGLPAPEPNQFYAISLEDAPGSPVGRPLGPILVQGLAVAPPR
jgi:anti-sigma-K factor RskA